jgi:AcrR family transcriptional regulator
MRKQKISDQPRAAPLERPPARRRASVRGKKRVAEGTGRLRIGIAQRRADRRAAGWRRSDARWEEIVAGAARVFSRLGYAQTSLEDVALEVGINRATLYYYVGTKAELLVSVLNRPVLQMTEDLRVIAALDLEPRAKLERAITKHMRDLNDNYPQLFIFLAENLHLMAGTMDPGITAASQEYGDILSTMIRDGVEAGVFRDDIDPHLAMLGIIGMCNWTYRWFSPRGPYSLVEVGEQFTRLAIDGLCAPAGRVQRKPPKRGAVAEKPVKRGRSSATRSIGGTR